MSHNITDISLNNNTANTNLLAAYGDCTTSVLKQLKKSEQKKVPETVSYSKLAENKLCDTM